MARQQGRSVPIPLEVNLFDQLCCHIFFSLRAQGGRGGKGCRRLEDGQIKLARFGFNGWTERDTRVCTINEEACALIES